VLLTAEAVCVYKALKADSLDTLQVNLSFQYGRVIAQEVSCRPFTAEARLQSQVIPCEVYGGRNGTGRGLSTRTCSFFLSVSFNQYTILFFIYMILVTEGQMGETGKFSNKQ
jgi:hypothetical protein